MRMRDLMNIVEGRIDEVSTDLATRANTLRQKHLNQLNYKGDEDVTPELINAYHDEEIDSIEAEQEEADIRYGKGNNEVMDWQKSENERDRRRNLSRHKALDTSKSKMNGTAKVPSRP